MELELKVGNIIINNNTDNSKMIRTKFDSFEMPEQKKDTEEAKKYEPITSLNVNEIVLDTTQHDQQHKTNGYIVSRIQNETSKELSNQTSPSKLTKQKLVKLSVKGFENDLDKKTVQTEATSSSSGFHKVLNKIVETGMQVTKASSLSGNQSFSKPPIS